MQEKWIKIAAYAAIFFAEFFAEPDLFKPVVHGWRCKEICAWEERIGVTL